MTLGRNKDKQNGVPQSVKISLNSKKVGESLILSPLGLESPAIHKVTVHPTGKHSLQPAITFDCISLYNLETLFTEPKTLQSGGRTGSIESMSSDSFFPKALQSTCFVFFFGFFLYSFSFFGLQLLQGQV